MPGFVYSARLKLKLRGCAAPSLSASPSAESWTNLHLAQLEARRVSW